MRPHLLAATALAMIVWTLGIVGGCASSRSRRPAGPARPAGAGFLLVAGEKVPVALRIVGPKDPGGFDASLERCSFRPDRVLPASPAPGCDVPERYGVRSTDGLSSATAGRVRRSGFDRAALAERVDQFVVHYDAAGTSRRCFEVLHDERGLSAHFLLDVDGTVRQTLDLAHRARHATISNDRSVGIEIAHVGAYRDESSFAPFYSRGSDGRLALAIPARFGPPPGGPFRPARDGYVEGTINGAALVQPDFTEAQYASLEVLVRELRRLFPRIAPRIPRDASGSARTDALDPADLAEFRGVLGHFHVQRDKSDPGPAFDWERIERAFGLTPRRGP